MADVGRWSGGVIGSIIPGTSWGAPNGLFPTEDDNPLSITYADATATFTLPALPAGYNAWAFRATFESEDSSNARTNYAARWTQTGGTGDFGCCYDAGFSRDNSEDRVGCNPIAILHDPGGTPTVQFQWLRDTDAPAATDGTVKSYVEIFPIKVADIAMYRSTNTGTYGGTTPTVVTLTNTDLEGTNITRSGNVITVTGDNKRYWILGSFFGRNYTGGTRTQRIAGLRYDGTFDEDTRAYTYNRNATNDIAGTTFDDIIETETASRTIEMAAYRGPPTTAEGGAEHDGTGTPNSVNHVLIVMELPDSCEVWRSHHDETDDQVVANTGPNDLTYMTSSRIDFNDSAAFTRASDTAVNCEKAMSVLASMNVLCGYNTWANSRYTGRGRITKNGAELDSTQDIEYGRGDQSSSGTGGLGLNPKGTVECASGDDLGGSIQEISGTEGGGGGVTTRSGNFYLINLDSFVVASESDGEVYETASARISLLGDVSETASAWVALRGDVSKVASAIVGLAGQVAAVASAIVALGGEASASASVNIGLRSEASEAASVRIEIPSGLPVILDAEDGDTDDWDSVTTDSGNTFTATTASKLNGSYGYEAAFGGANREAYGALALAAGEPDFWVGFRLKLDTGYDQSNYASNTLLQVFDGTTGLLTIQLYDPVGSVFQLSVDQWKPSYSSLGFTDTDLTVGVEYWVEVRFYSHVSAGAIEVWIGDTKEVEATGLNTSTWEADGIEIGGTGFSGSAIPTAGSSIFLDDITLSDTRTGDPLATTPGEISEAASVRVALPSDVSEAASVRISVENESEVSESASVRVALPGEVSEPASVRIALPIPAPTDLVANNTDASITDPEDQLYVSWTDNTGGANNHAVLYRENGTGDPYLRVNLPAGTTSHILTGLDPGTEYEITVIAYDGADESARPTPVTASTQGPSEVYASASVFVEILSRVYESASVRVALRGEVSEAASALVSVPGESYAPASVRISVESESEVSEPASVLVSVAGEVYESASARVALRGQVVSGGGGATTVLDDSFTDTDGTRLDNHTPEVGGTWTRNADSDYSQITRYLGIDENGRVEVQVTYTWAAHYQPLMSEADFDLTATLYFNSNDGTGWARLWIRSALDELTGYCLMGHDGHVILYEYTAGSATELESYDGSYNGESVDVRLKMIGGAYTLWIEDIGDGDTPYATGTDSEHPGAGYCQIQQYGTATKYVRIGSIEVVTGNDGASVNVALPSDVSEAASARVALPSETSEGASVNISTASPTGEVYESASARIALPGDTSETASISVALRGQVAGDASAAIAQRSESASNASALVAGRGAQASDGSVHVAQRGLISEASSVRVALPSEVASAGSVRISSPAEVFENASVRIVLTGEGEVASTASVEVALRGQASSAASVEVALRSEVASNASALVAGRGAQASDGSVHVERLGQVAGASSVRVALPSEVAEVASVRVALRGHLSEVASARVSAPSEVASAASVRITGTAASEVSEAASVLVSPLGEVSESASVRVALRGEVYEGASARIALPGQASFAASVAINLPSGVSALATTLLSKLSESAASASARLALRSSVSGAASARLALRGDSAAPASVRVELTAVASEISEVASVRIKPSSAVHVSASATVALPGQAPATASALVGFRGQAYEDASARLALPGEISGAASVRIETPSIPSESAETASVLVAVAGETTGAASTRVALRGQVSEAASIEVSRRAEVYGSASVRVSLLGRVADASSVRVSIPSATTRAASVRTSLRGRSAVGASVAITSPDRGLVSPFSADIEPSGTSAVLTESQAEAHLSASVSDAAVVDSRTGADVESSATEAELPMAGTYHIKRRDLEPPLVATLKNADGSAIDLSSGSPSIVFSMSRPGEATPTVNRQIAAIVTAAEGVVRYDWQAGDTDEAGDKWRGEFEITWAGGRPQTVPNTKHIPIVIEPDIA